MSLFYSLFLKTCLFMKKLDMATMFVTKFSVWEVQIPLPIVLHYSQKLLRLQTFNNIIKSEEKKKKKINQTRVAKISDVQKIAQVTSKVFILPVLSQVNSLTSEVMCKHLWCESQVFINDYHSSCGNVIPEIFQRLRSTLASSEIKTVFITCHQK